MFVHMNIYMAFILECVPLQHPSTTTNTASNGTGASESADDDLPSVMTCANYLKLPPYSTKVPYFWQINRFSQLYPFVTNGY